MSLIDCKDCGNGVSLDSPKCPNCGASNLEHIKIVRAKRNTFIKKVSVICLIIALMIPIGIFCKIKIDTDNRQRQAEIDLGIAQTWDLYDTSVLTDAQLNDLKNIVFQEKLTTNYASPYTVAARRIWNTYMTTKSVKKIMKIESVINSTRFQKNLDPYYMQNLQHSVSTEYSYFPTDTSYNNVIFLQGWYRHQGSFLDALRIIKVSQMGYQVNTDPCNKTPKNQICGASGTTTKNLLPIIIRKLNNS
jgi:hypothetical protein